MFLEHILKIGEKVVREVAAMWGRRVALTISRTETFFGSTENRFGYREAKWRSAEPYANRKLINTELWIFPTGTPLRDLVPDPLGSTGGPQPRCAISRMGLE